MTIFSPHGGIVSREADGSPEVTSTPTIAEVGDYQPVLERYEVPAGRILVARDRTPETWDDAGLIEMTDDRKQLVQQFEPWATVLMVGPSFKTDYGTTIDAPNVKQGQRILIAPTAGKDVELKHGGVSMMVTLIGFAGVMLIDRGETS